MFAWRAPARRDELELGGEGGEGAPGQSSALEREGGIVGYSDSAFLRVIRRKQTKKMTVSIKWETRRWDITVG